MIQSMRISLHGNRTGKTRRKRQSNFTPLEPRKEKQTKPKVIREKKITKIRREINEIEIRKTIEKINEIKSWLFEKINKIDKF